MKMIRWTLTALALGTCLIGHAQPLQPPAGRASAGGVGPASFAEFDHDGNGTISEAEFDAVRTERRSAAAQAGRPMRRAAMSLTFKEMDRDGNGELTREEFAGAHATQPSQRRWGRGMGPGAGQGAAAGPGAGPGAQGGMNPPAFADFDLNGNGSITEPEFHAARSGRITSRLQEGRQMRNLQDAAASFADMDANHDGQISRGEFAAHQAARARGPVR